MGANEDRKSAWDGYRVLAKIRWMGVGIWALSAAVITFDIVPELGFLVWFVGWFAIISEYWFKCPRCGGGFFRSWGFYDPLAMYCRNCGLPKWTEPPYPVWRPPSLPRKYAVPDLKIARRKTHLTFLTLVLRDDPGAIGLKLDKDGWAAVDDLLKRAERYRIKLFRDDLDEILSNSENGLFESRASGAKIRFQRNV